MKTTLKITALILILTAPALGVFGLPHDLGIAGSPSISMVAVGDFDIHAAPPRRTVDAGDNTFYTVVVKFHNFDGPVSLSVEGLPAGADWSFDKNPVEPNGQCESCGNAETKLRISTEKTAPAGTYTLTIVGESDEVGRRTDTVTLVIEGGQQGDFDIQASPSSRTVDAGTGTFYAVVVTFDDFDDPVSLSVRGLPTGTDGSFDDNPVAPDKNCGCDKTETKLRITTEKTAPAGTYTLTIVGESEGVGTRSDTVTLVIKGEEPEGHLVADPTTNTIDPGDAARYTVTGRSNADFEAELSVSGLVAGMSASFEPTAVITSQSPSTVLVVKTDASVAAGTYKLDVKASGGIDDGVTVTLIVGDGPVEEESGNLSVRKSATPTSVKVGSVVIYTLHIDNTGRGAVSDVVIRDTLPTGVGYVSGSTIKDGKFFSDPTGSSTLLWRLGELAAGESITLKYHVTVKGNASRGLMTNRVVVTGTDRRGVKLSDTDTADISLSGDVMERKGKIKGSVFVDANENGMKNADETGLGGVTLVMENGERVTSEEDGSFLFDEVKPGEHLVALDERKLPDDYFLIGESSIIVSVFWGGTSRVEFSLGYIPPPPPPPTAEEMLALREAEKKALEEKKKQEEEKKKQEEKNKESTGKVSGRVYVDSNDNGVYDRGETGAEGVVVLLDGTKTATTDRRGNFAFDNISPGAHVVSLLTDSEFSDSFRPGKKDRERVTVTSNVTHLVELAVFEVHKLTVEIELDIQ
ncbi:MAG: DUF11 domain-containing protein [Deltaproteobacteria bacterium]|nr:DUF11 domain-containing protein [Candidatus Zymogenaceae bacterium]